MRKKGKLVHRVVALVMHLAERRYHIVREYALPSACLFSWLNLLIATPARAFLKYDVDPPFPSSITS
jgi:hypothetical protein